jgi:tetratricopeptide (TPR) repeat protein
MNRTCFVISPIGDKGSDIRLRSDALYDLIIEPALEKYSFTITRADKNFSVSSITSEIIQQVQDSGLCIIDITGHNPNVMYECGRRHETAKPYIMIAQEGEKLPFDINTIRTVFYNLSDAREIRNTVKVLQQIIEKLLEGGLEPERSGESLTALSETLVRIERKVDRLGAMNTGNPTSPVSIGTQEYQEILQKLGLNSAFSYSVQQRNTGLMDFLIPRLERQMLIENFIDQVLTVAAPLGSALAHTKLIEKYGILDTLSPALRADYISSLVAGFCLQDREQDGVAFLEEFFIRIYGLQAPSPDISSKDKAFLLNQYQRLLFGSGNFDKALEVQKDVLELCPEDSAYIYNMVLIYEQLGEDDSAYVSVKRLYELSKQIGKFTDMQLCACTRIFAKNADPLAYETFNMLQEQNSYRATMLRQDSRVSSFLRL